MYLEKSLPLSKPGVLGVRHTPPYVGRLLVDFFQEIAGLSYGTGDLIAGSLRRTNPRYCFRTQRCCWDPEVSMEPGGRFRSPEAAPDPKVIFRTRRSLGNPEVPSDPEVIFRTRRSF